MPETTQYAALTDEALINLLFTEEDRLPRAAADEIVRRGVPVAPALFRILEDGDLWDDESPRWWAIVHAAFLLAAMQPPGALEALLPALEKAEEVDNDWLCDEAPQLLASFGPQAVPLLTPLALDSELDLYFRISIIEALTWIGRNHAEVRDDATGALRQILLGTSEDSDLRAWAASHLLKFAVPEDRDLILSGVDDYILERKFAEKVFSGQEPLQNPPALDWMNFYDPDEIAHRQAEQQEFDSSPGEGADE